MEKTTNEMNLDEWEFLSDDEDVGRAVLVSNKLDFNRKGVLEENYFEYPLPNSRRIVNISKSSTSVPKPIHLDEEVVKEVIKVPIVEVSTKVPSVREDEELITQQVSFKKTKGNEFVDIKMDSPKSSTRNIMNQFADKKEDKGMENKICSKEELVQENKCLDSNIKEVIKWEESGFNIWRWRISGIGALCSLGMAAATICIFILGSQQRHKHHQQNQKLRFQIYTDDKRFKQVVHHATKFNQAISSVRVGPFNRAHFTFGGNCVYDGL